MQHFSTSDDAKVVRACGQCLPKLSHDSFSESVVPRITVAWNCIGEAAAIADACLDLGGSPEVEIREVVSMVTTVTGALRYLKDRTTKTVTGALWHRKRLQLNGRWTLRPDRAEDGLAAPPARTDGGKHAGTRPRGSGGSGSARASVGTAGGYGSAGVRPNTAAQGEAFGAAPPAEEEAHAPAPAPPSLFARMNTRPAKPSTASMFSRLKMGGARGRGRREDVNNHFTEK